MTYRIIFLQFLLTISTKLELLTSLWQWDGSNCSAPAECGGVYFWYFYVYLFCYNFVYNVQCHFDIFLKSTPKKLDLSLG